MPGSDDDGSRVVSVDRSSSASSGVVSALSGIFAGGGRSWSAFLAFNSGFYLSYLLVGLSQESIYNTKFTDDGAKFTNPAFLVFMMFLTNAMVSLFVLSAKEMPLVPQAPWRNFALLAVSHGLSMWCANRAMLDLDYPTQTLFKSCKPLPVFVTGAIFFKRGYSMRRGIPVLFVLVGLVGFMYLKVITEKGAFEAHGAGWSGTVFVCCALALDGLTGYLQDVICKGYYNDALRRPIAPWHLMLFVNSLSALYAFVAQTTTGRLLETAAFVLSSSKLSLLVLAFSVSSALGQLFVYFLVAAYDSLTCSIMTTLRKFLTIVLSIFWFGHRVLPMQWIFIFTVFCGIGVEVIQSHSSKNSNSGQKPKMLLPISHSQISSDGRKGELQRD